jgi:hypothetical protein
VRDGGHDEKSGLATTEMSFNVPVSSRSGTASTRTRTVLPGCTRPRSNSSTRAVIRTALKSGSSAIGAPNQARSPRLNSGAARENGPPARVFGSSEIEPPAGARTVSAAMIRSVSATS